jgi:hypothetical protein
MKGSLPIKHRAITPTIDANTKSCCWVDGSQAKIDIVATDYFSHSISRENLSAFAMKLSFIHT